MRSSPKMCIFNSLKFSHHFISTQIFDCFHGVYFFRHRSESHLHWVTKIECRKSRLIRDQSEMIINIGAFLGESFPFGKVLCANSTLKVGHTHTIVLFRFDFFVVSFYFSGYHHHSILMFRLVHSFRVWIPLSSSHNPCRPFCYH